MVRSSRVSAAIALSISASRRGRRSRPDCRSLWWPRPARTRWPHPSPGVAEIDALDGDVEIEILDAGAVLHASTSRSVASTPSVPRFLINAAWCGWNDGSSSRNSIVKALAVGLQPLAVLDDDSRHPEHLRGLAQQAAILSRPSDTGGTKARRTLPPAPCRGTARAMSSSSGDGVPLPSCPNSGTARCVRA